MHWRREIQPASIWSWQKERSVWKQLVDCLSHYWTEIHKDIKVSLMISQKYLKERLIDELASMMPRNYIVCYSEGKPWLLKDLISLRATLAILLLPFPPTVCQKLKIEAILRCTWKDVPRQAGQLCYDQNIIKWLAYIGNKCEIPLFGTQKQNFNNNCSQIGKLLSC